ncbi:putative protein of unknown function DUF2828 [Aeromonas phage LAh_8]|uniref:DUF2828 domain-containing protein n=1 Tax=Aeromonas phage LAh_8 TaxID=2591032 RepID=A0A514A0C0_9CAUD|nr:RNA-binding protein [Aeromonas phage LAh_8]QDH46728.1 putative protein of unknown function DUF2828 [Aeromonas phage LAh_8]
MFNWMKLKGTCLVVECLQQPLSTHNRNKYILKGVLMNLFQAINNNGRTENGARTNLSSLNPCVDLFFTIGASRGRDLSGAFANAFGANPEIATRILLWSRDVREGAGERAMFRNLLHSMITYVDPELINRIIFKIPELGRFDDLEILWGTRFEKVAASLWVDSIVAGNGLAAKWAPVKDKKGAFPLRSVMGLDERGWRKFIVPLRTTVEQKMCANQWDQIEFGKLPSLAASRYTKAFHRHDTGAYTEYLESLKKGEAKVNAGALFPYNPVQAIRMGGDATVASKQWEVLKDFVTTEQNYLPIIDVSGSMATPVGGNPNLNCMMVAASLGMYLAERNKGIFKDQFITFHTNPTFIQMKGDFPTRVNQVFRAPWSGSTDLEAVFRMVLSAAVANKLPVEEMPTHLFIISDMEFNSAFGRPDRTLFQTINSLYERAGYPRPGIIFWRVDSRAPNSPVTVNDNNVALVSGFSPSLVKPLLEGGDLSPEKAMLDVIMSDRYKV